MTSDGLSKYTTKKKFELEWESENDIKRKKKIDSQKVEIKIAKKRSKYRD